MYADPKDIRSRRRKRRFKALASIALATAAGVFLACQRKLTEPAAPAATPAPSPRGPDARSGPEPRDLPDASTGSVEVPDGGDEAASSGGARDASSERQRDAHVDVTEHRKGMPVRDNLLE
ncbi:MAG: hypothetical protein R3B13_33370 [Polyangiaceae bacterium]